MSVPQQHIPGKYAILPYYALGACCLVLICVLNLLAVPSFPGHYFQPKLLAITHLYVLGWATMVILGAGNQIAPVMADQRLYSDKLPLAACGLLTGGLALLIPGFWQFRLDNMALTGASLIILALLLHIYNSYRTMVKKKAPDIGADLFLSAHAWLLLTVLLGATLLLNLRYGFLPEEHLHYLKIHAGIGLAGWLLQLVIGAGSRLIPMFLLSRKEGKKYLQAAYYAINGSLVMLLVEGLVFHSQTGWPLYLLLLAAGLIAFGLYVRGCYVSALRKTTDAGMKATLLGLCLLALPMVLLLLTYRPDAPVTLGTAFGFSLMGGMITTMIMGQTFKTLPFIIWMHLTGNGQQSALLPKDLYAEKYVRLQAWIYLPGCLLFLSGILAGWQPALYVGGTLMLLAAMMYAVHVFYLLRQLI